MLQFMGSQRVGHDRATELNRTMLLQKFSSFQKIMKKRFFKFIFFYKEVKGITAYIHFTK